MKSRAQTLRTAPHLALSRSPKAADPLCDSRQGTVLVLVAALIFSLIVAVAFGVDIAYIQLARAELRATTDVAARAAAQTLAKVDSVEIAREAGMQIARTNSVGGRPVYLAQSQVVFGRSQLLDDGSYGFTENKTPFNAVRVVGKLGHGSPTSALPLFFGRIWNDNSIELTQQATASFSMSDICLVLDRSGSMKRDVSYAGGGYGVDDAEFYQPPVTASKWVALEDAVRGFAEIIEKENQFSRVSIVSYSSDLDYTHPVYGPISNPATRIEQTLTSDLSLIVNVVETLSATVWDGATYIEAGMREGTSILLAGPGARINANKVMIVFTDGWQNIGDAEAAARDAVEQEIAIHCVGLGQADFGLLDRMAAAGSGLSLKAATRDELRAAFERLASETTQLIE